MRMASSPSGGTDSGGDGKRADQAARRRIAPPKGDRAGKLTAMASATKGELAAGERVAAATAARSSW